MRTVALHVSRRLIRGLCWGVAATGAAQAAVAAGLLGIDALRKRREPPQPDFPRAMPRTVPVAGSDVTTYTSGRDLFDDMLAAIDAAQDTVYFESYIWKGDEYGTRFRDALSAAGRRGVHVCAIYDGFANLVVDPRFYRLHPAVHVLRFPVVRSGMFLLSLRRLGRDHRKILVVDGDVGFVGGYNIGDVYADSWRDTHVRIEGPAVWELEDAFVDFWNEYRGRRRPELPERGTREWDARIVAARNAPSRMLFPIRGIYIAAIERAVDHVWITQGYFIPDSEIHSSLLRAARRGVDVRVIIPEYSNHILADWVARGYYTSLLRGGVTIWLYRNAMVHAKTATVDGRWSTVGTANIDRLSMLGNYEVNLELFDEDMAAKLEEIFEMDLTNCRQLTLDEWEGRALYVRAVEHLLAPLYPLF